jgi:hypothetical protein
MPLVPIGAMGQAVIYVQDFTLPTPLFRQSEGSKNCSVCTDIPAVFSKKKIPVVFK